MRMNQMPLNAPVTEMVTDDGKYKIRDCINLSPDMDRYLDILYGAGKTDETLRIKSLISKFAFSGYRGLTRATARVIEDTHNDVVGGVLLSNTSIIPITWNQLSSGSSTAEEELAMKNINTLRALQANGVSYFSHEVPNDQNNIEPLIRLMESFRFSSDIPRAVYGILTLEDVENELLENRGFSKVQHDDKSYMAGLHRPNRTYIRS